MRNNNEQLTPEEIQGLLDKWTKILNIEEWDYEVYLVDEEEYHDEFPNQERTTNACNKFAIDSKASQIFIKKETDLTFEECLVHELIHIVLADLTLFMDDLCEDRPESSKILMSTATRYLEQAVHMLTKSHLRLTK